MKSKQPRLFWYTLIEAGWFKGSYNKVPINISRSDWLKHSALSENRARVDDMKLAFKFLLDPIDSVGIRLGVT